MEPIFKSVFVVTAKIYTVVEKQKANVSEDSVYLIAEDVDKALALGRKYFESLDKPFNVYEIITVHRPDDPGEVLVDIENEDEPMPFFCMGDSDLQL